jgi:hypothetical protein
MRIYSRGGCEVELGEPRGARPVPVRDGLLVAGGRHGWRDPAPNGTVWTLTNVLVYVAVIGLVVAAWGMFKQYAWWEMAAVAPGIAGLVAVVSFAAGQSQLDVGFADFGGQINLWMHFLGCAAVVAIGLVPVAHDWVPRRP